MKNEKIILKEKSRINSRKYVGSYATESHQRSVTYGGGGGRRVSSHSRGRNKKKKKREESKRWTPIISIRHHAFSDWRFWQLPSPSPAQKHGCAHTHTHVACAAMTTTTTERLFRCSWRITCGTSTYQQMTVRTGLNGLWERQRTWTTKNERNAAEGATTRRLHGTGQWSRGRRKLECAAPAPADCVATRSNVRDSGTTPQRRALVVSVGHAAISIGYNARRPKTTGIVEREIAGALSCVFVVGGGTKSTAVMAVVAWAMGQYGVRRAPPGRALGKSRRFYQMIRRYQHCFYYGCEATHPVDST